MTTINYIGWAWIIWTLLNEGLAYMVERPARTEGRIGVGVCAWAFSALAVWAALS